MYDKAGEDYKDYKDYKDYIDKEEHVDGAQLELKDLLCDLPELLRLERESNLKIRTLDEFRSYRRRPLFGEVESGITDVSEPGKDQAGIKKEDKFPQEGDRGLGAKPPQRPGTNSV